MSRSLTPVRVRSKAFAHRIVRARVEQRTPVLGHSDGCQAHTHRSAFQCLGYARDYAPVPNTAWMLASQRTAHPRRAFS
jgi:hypothetical protein